MRVLFLLVLCFLSAFEAAEDQIAIESGYIPQTVYLEATSGGGLLNFDCRFKPIKAGKVFIVLFYYLDREGNVLMIRRLAPNPPFENVGIHLAVFTPGKPPILHQNSFQAGDSVFIAHPYEQIPSHFPVKQVKCQVILTYEDKSYEELEIRVPVRKYRPKSAFHPPFEGSWIHLQGHDLRTHHRQIYYHKNSNYFAIDFLKVDAKGGLVKPGVDGSSLSDYYSYGAKVLSPGDGVVVEIVDRFEDAPIGGRAKDMDPNFPGGNHILIQHEPNLFSYLAHLQKGSFQVKVGDRVKTGQKLALCGNSGNSDAPHIHFHQVPEAQTHFLKVHGLPAVYRKFQTRVGDRIMVHRRRGSFPGEIILGQE